MLYFSQGGGMCSLSPLPCLNGALVYVCPTFLWCSVVLVFFVVGIGVAEGVVAMVITGGLT